MEIYKKDIHLYTELTLVAAGVILRLDGCDVCELPLLLSVDWDPLDRLLYAEDSRLNCPRPPPLPGRLPGGVWCGWLATDADLNWADE